MKCKLCDGKLNWSHSFEPLPQLVGYDPTVTKRFCRKCWNRIWAEWYEYNDERNLAYDMAYENPSDEYIIKKYKGNDLVATIAEKEIIKNKDRKRLYTFRKSLRNAIKLLYKD